MVMTGTVNAWRSVPANVSAHLEACSELWGPCKDVNFLAKKVLPFFLSNSLESFIALTIPLENNFLFDQVRLLPVSLPWVPRVMKYKVGGKTLVPS